MTLSSDRRHGSSLVQTLVPTRQQSGFRPGPLRGSDLHPRQDYASTENDWPSLMLEHILQRVPDNFSGISLPKLFRQVPLEEDVVLGEWQRD